MSNFSFSMRMKRWGKYLRNYMKERAHGLDFSMVYVGDIQRNTEEFHGYSMTDEDDLKHMLRALPVDPHETAFLDVGCGKGMCMKCASDLGFRLVDGVELDPHLVEIARKNMKILKLNARCYQDNAVDFAWYAEYDVFYFYNPFGKSVFEQVIERIKTSQDLRNRDIWIVYYHPVNGKLFENAGFVLNKEIPDKTRDTTTAFYFYPKRA